jgi:hypothetical protein
MFTDAPAQMRPAFQHPAVTISMMMISELEFCTGSIFLESRKPKYRFITGCSMMNARFPQ